MNKLSYFEWIKEICKLLNRPAEDGGILVEDVSWFGCYDDGMSPQQAIDEATEKNILTDYFK